MYNVYTSSIHWVVCLVYTSSIHCVVHLIYTNSSRWEGTLRALCGKEEEEEEEWLYSIIRHQKRANVKMGTIAYYCMHENARACAGLRVEGCIVIVIV